MTGYVATRWYRAPEIMLNWMHYNQNGAMPSHYRPLKLIEHLVIISVVFLFQLTFGQWAALWESC